MKVVKSGDASKRVADRNETMNVKCECCSARLAIYPSDLDRRGGVIRKLRYKFTCPECNGTTYILPEKLEPAFRRRADEEIANRRFWQD